MKRAGHLMERICEVDNLLLAYYKASRGKQLKTAVRIYAAELMPRLLKLRQSLLLGTAQLGKYHFFMVHDPKLRKICAASFEEKIIHHAVMNVCKPYFERNLIYDTYATRDGKGVYAALGRARQGLRRYGYVAKLDVRKYFDTISHEVLKQQLRCMFKDAALLELLDGIIDSYEVMSGCGVPIGNLTSQYFANLYLSGLDHYVKEEMRVSVYVRYMDDMLLFGESKEQVKGYVAAVERFVGERLRLHLKPLVLNASKRGISFLGYNLFPHKILLNRHSKLRFKHKLHQYADAHERGVWNDEMYMAHIIPLMAFAKKAYTKRLRLVNVDKGNVVDGPRAGLTA
ncbi:MAG: RNA-directed DNA polymerase [Bacteroides sp.]|nr:RNA-directed DNA polymerase [Bacteroides sp.]